MTTSPLVSAHDRSTGSARPGHRPRRPLPDRRRRRPAGVPGGPRARRGVRRRGRRPRRPARRAGGARRPAPAPGDRGLRGRHAPRRGCAATARWSCTTTGAAARAARAWWLLRYHGHRDVRVLDGGWSAWRDAGGEVEEGQVTPEPGDFEADPGHLPVVETEDVLAVEVLVDARAHERYAGEHEPIDPVAGHVPGAVNVPTTDNLGRRRPVQGRRRAAPHLRGGRRGRRRRRGGVLRLRRDRLPRHPGAGRRAGAGRAVGRVVERLGQRPGAPGGRSTSLTSFCGASRQ